jgi:hypothetical protein
MPEEKVRAPAAERVRLGVSACRLGDAVRGDGGHTLAAASRVD